MPIELTVPRLGWSMEEGAFVAWLKQDGELVRAGDALFSIEGDKAVQEIESMDSGILRIAPNGPAPGAVIRVGDLLGHLLSPEEAAVGAPASPPAPSASGPTFIPPKSRPLLPATEVPRPEAARSESSAARVSTEAEVARASAPASAGRGPTISPRALRVAAELGVDWTKALGTGRTGRIRERDIRAMVGLGAPERSGARSASPDPAARSFDDRRGEVMADDRTTVLVTGGGGFIGTWVVRELLAQDRRVVVLDTGERPARWERIIGARSREVTLVHGSLLDREQLARAFANHAFTHVIHLAALLTPACQTDPWEGCQANILGTVALLEQLRVAGDRVRGFSYASSVAVFGDEPDHGTGVAGGGNRPLTFYGAFKKSAEMIAEQYWLHFQVASVGIRPQVVYGPEREVGLTAGPSLAARAAARGEAYGIGYTGRVGYDYVEDVARAFVRAALETPAGAQVVDLPGSVVDVADVAAAIVAAAPGAAGRVTASGPAIPAHAPPHPRFISELYPDWMSTSLAAGMRRTVEYYQSQLLLARPVNADSPSG